MFKFLRLFYNFTMVAIQFQNLYDRVAGDDAETGDDEIDLPVVFRSKKSSQTSKPNSIIQELPSNSIASSKASSDRSSRDTTRQHKNDRDRQTINGLRVESPVPLPRSTKMLSQTSQIDGGSEEKVIMRITPKPPVRKRPKSTPVFDHVANQLSQMMEEKMR